MAGQFSDFVDLDELEDFDLGPLLTHILNERDAPAEEVIDVDALPDPDDDDTSASSSCSTMRCSSPAPSVVFSDVSNDEMEIQLEPTVEGATICLGRARLTNPPPCAWAPGPSSLRLDASQNVAQPPNPLLPPVGTRRIHMAVVSGVCL